MPPEPPPPSGGSAAPPPAPPPAPLPDQRAAETIFTELLALSSPAERERVLAARAAGDPQLARDVRALLAAHEAAGDFLETAVLTPEVEANLAKLKPEQAGERIGPYKLLQQIGEGGFGVVWMAEQEQPMRRRVALKVIKLGMDTKQTVARFEQERQALAMMDHPNIAKVFDAGATPTGRPFFVMELVRGIPITKYCDQANLPTAERLQLFIAVCHAVQHAHQKGIIHRDLKPSNILVTLHDGVPVPKVIDFGVAKATQQRLTDLTVFTQFEQMIGTPLYMSPEQAEMSSLDIDTRTDIYALGVLLYELLTGRTPFDPKELLKRGLDEIRRAIREQEPPRPSTALTTMAADAMTAVAQHRQSDSAKLIGLLRGDLDWIVMKAIEKNRTRRYDTANAFAEDIQRHLAGEPVVACPPSTAYLLQKLVRRNKLAFAASAAVAVALVLGIAVSAWQAVRASREAERARVAEQMAKQRVVEVAAERDAKDKARQEAEAVSTFLTEVFQSPDPARDGRTITVAETLDRAVKKLETDLASQPERRARLQSTLGETYIALGLPHKAVPLLEKARDYALTTLGPEHPQTLTAMFWLARSYYDVGRRDEALKMREEVLALCRKLNGPEHPDTLMAMANLADSYHDVGRRDEALKMQEEVLALRRKMLGPEHPATLTAMSNLAGSYDYAGRRDEALKMREEVLALRRKMLGPEHPDTLTAMNNLAGSYYYAGRRDEALKTQEEVLTHRRKVLGPEHPDTLGAMAWLASYYHDVGRRDEALKMQEEVLTLRRKVLGPEHPDTLGAMNAVANSYEAAGRCDEALKMREEVLALRRKVLGLEHLDTLNAMSWLAYSYAAVGRRDEALKMREEVLALRRKVLGLEHLDTLNAMSWLAYSYAALGRRDEALKMREEVLALRRKVLGPEYPDTLTTMYNLAGSYSDAGRLEDAFPLWVESSVHLPKDTSLALKVATLQVWFGKDADHAATCRRILELAAGTDNASTADRAAKAYCLRPSSDPQLIESAVTLARRAVDLGKLQWYQMALGMAEYRHGNFPAADQALSAAEKADKDDRLVQGPARLFHAMSLFRQGKEAEARQLFTEAEAEMKPLPADERQPLAKGAGTDDVIVWLAYKEAKALLKSDAKAAPAKP